MTEPRLGPSHNGSVVLDIGGEIGALVLYTPEALLGAEINLAPARSGVATTHSAVRERQLGHGRIFAAVYPALPAGDYTVEPTGQPVLIEGGCITELRWPASTGRQEPSASGPVGLG
jgi:hypothetical protein